jgi:hypothetical protein
MVFCGAHQQESLKLCIGVPLLASNQKLGRRAIMYQALWGKGFQSKGRRQNWIFQQGIKPVDEI